ncbi:Sec63 Brl domain-containing protein [Globomyces pollinis-pini]|nr:Sec63 Brl domain-containing protein [Globomyces pollinis-pini]
MAQYAYDDTGAIFSYFSLACLSILLLPYSYSTLFSSPVKLPPLNCPCPQCARKSIKFSQKKTNWKKYILLILGWLLFTFTFYCAYTLKQVEPELWDPYNILGIDQSADEKLVKKSYRKLSLIWHPDKFKGTEEEKEAANQKFVDLTKAYTVLTDPEAKAIWDEFGHPDGKQAFQLGVALPSWLVEKGNSSLVLLMYTVVFGLGLPIVVAQWWRNAKVVSKNQVLNATMEVFYRDLKDTVQFKGILEIIIQADEFLQVFKPDTDLSTEFGKLEVKLMGKLKNNTLLDFNALKKNPNLNETSRYTLYLLLAHLLRIVPDSAVLESYQDQVVEIAVRLCAGLIQISVSRNWLRATLQTLNFSQYLVQALLPGQSSLLQLPFVTAAMVKEWEVDGVSIDTLPKFIELGERERGVLLENLDKEKAKIVQTVADKYPLVKISKAEYSVYGEPAIVPSSLVTLSVKFRFQYGRANPKLVIDTSIMDPEEEKKTKQWWAEKQQDKFAPHCPFFAATKKPTYTVILANAKIGRLITYTKVVGATQDQTVRLQFQAPPEPGSWTFQIYIKSDTFQSCDHQFDLKLTVDSHDAIPESPVYEDISTDEESETEEEVTKVKKVRKAKAVRGEYDDSSDSDCEDEEEEEEDDDFIDLVSQLMVLDPVMFDVQTIDLVFIVVSAESYSYKQFKLMGLRLANKCATLNDDDKLNGLIFKYTKDTDSMTVTIHLASSANGNVVLNLGSVITNSLQTVITFSKVETRVFWDLIRLRESHTKSEAFPFEKCHEHMMFEHP